MLNPQTLNRYSYVANDPINSTDPTGQFLTAMTLFLDRAGFPNAWANMNEFAMMDIPFRIGTAYLFHSDSSNFHFEDFSHNELMAFANQGEISLWGTYSVYGSILVSPTGGDSSSFKPSQMRKRIVDLLRAQNDCTNWMNKGTGSAADIMSNVPIKLGRPTGNVVPSYDALTGDDPKDPIVVNPSGRFYAGGPNGLLVGDVYAPGSDGARMAILLHEVAHKVNPPGMIEENSNTDKSDQNTATVVNHCQNAIDKASTSH